jgi:hypothetical protein
LEAGLWGTQTVNAEIKRDRATKNGRSATNKCDAMLNAVSADKAEDQQYKALLAVDSIHLPV